MGCFSDPETDPETDPGVLSTGAVLVLVLVFALVGLLAEGGSDLDLDLDDLELDDLLECGASEDLRAARCLSFSRRRSSFSLMDSSSLLVVVEVLLVVLVLVVGVFLDVT